jgi:hypothetical protein
MKIIFQFAGGPMDGKQVAGKPGDQGEADRFYVLTHHGRLGQRFRIASDYAINILAEEQLKQDEPHYFQAHTYQVTDCRQTADALKVRAEYVSPPPKK